MTTHFCNIAVAAKGGAPLAFIGFGENSAQAEGTAKARIMAAFILFEDDDGPLSDAACSLASTDFDEMAAASGFEWQIAEVGEV